MAGRRATRAGHRGAVDLGAQCRARRRQQELQLGESLEVHRGLLGERVAGGQDEHQVLVEELCGHDLVAAEGERHDRKVQLARCQLLLELDARAFGDVEMDVGVADPQEVEELGDEPPTRRADHAEAYRPDHLFAQRGHVGHHRLELVHHPPRPLDHDVSLLGQPARGTVDQLDVELALEAGHVGRDVGLHGPDGRRGGREAAGVGDAQQCLQMFQFHVAPGWRMLAPVIFPISITDRKYLLKLLD